MNGLTFLESPGKAKPAPLWVLCGDEAFLKRQCRLGLRTLVLGEDDGFGVSAHRGEQASWSDVLTDLQTLPFLSPRKLVVVEGADPFVTRERARLEKFVAAVAKDRPADPKSVLVLDVTLWQASTKLAKATPDAWVLSCKAPPSHELPKWCVGWCAAQTGKGISAAAAKLLVDLAGADMGVLDQELQKLALYVGSAPKIEAKDVDELVGRSRTESTWQIFDHIAAAEVGPALDYLGRLLDQGEEPMRLLGAFGSQLRRLAQVTRLCAQGVSMGEAMDRTGSRGNDERLIRHLGRRRLDRIYDWLLELDVGLKGGSQLPARTLLERFVVRLARPRA